MIMSYNSSSLFFLLQAPYNDDNQHQTSHYDSFFVCLFGYMYFIVITMSITFVIFFFGVFDIKKA